MTHTSTQLAPWLWFDRLATLHNSSWEAWGVGTRGQPSVFSARHVASGKGVADGVPNQHL